MSESLAWEKWSSFSHNRYVEEAERYSRPGSVAQKKAFFEAHYKKLAAQKAAALLEQENNAAAQNNGTGQVDDEGVVDNTNSDAHNSETTNTNNPVAAQNNATGKEDEGVVDNNSSAHNSDTRSSDSKIVVKEEQDVMLRANSGSSVEASIIPQSNKVEGAEQEMEQEAFGGNSMKIELQNQLEGVDAHKEQIEKISVTPPVMTPIMKVIMLI